MTTSPDLADHLDRLLRTAGDGLKVDATTLDEEEGPDIPFWDGFSKAVNDGWTIFVNGSLSVAAAEATGLHELAHIFLDHPDSDAYREAWHRDANEGTDKHRAPWEDAANALATALAESHAADLHSPLEEILEVLSGDTARFSR